MTYVSSPRYYFFFFAQLVNKLRSVYTHPNDVDLVIGGMAERSPDDGLLGPTFRCLILEQFARTLRTDRFFYDSAMQPYPFTPGKIYFFTFNYSTRHAITKVY